MWHFQFEDDDASDESPAWAADYFEVSGSSKEPVFLRGNREEAIEVDMEGHDIVVTLHIHSFDCASVRFLLEYHGMYLLQNENTEQLRIYQN